MAFSCFHIIVRFLVNDVAIVVFTITENCVDENRAILSMIMFLTTVRFLINFAHMVELPEEQEE